MLRIKSSLTGKEYQFPDGFDTQMAGELIKEQERPFTSQDMIAQRLNPVASASPTTPTLRDRFGTTVREGLESVGFSRSGARGASEGFQNISDFIPMTAASYAGDSFGREMAEDDYFGAAGSLAEGALEVNPVTKAVGDAAMFIGAKSKLFNQEAADLAKDLEAKGASDIEIWNKTGELGAPMHKSPEGVYLQEIPDDQGGFVTSDMALMSDNIGANSFQLDGKFYSASPSMKLGDVLEHPSLFDHYPELKDMQIYVAEGNAPFGGMVQDGKMYVNDLLVEPEYYDDLYKTILHETQHAVSGSEKALGSGGSPAGASRFQMGLLGRIEDREEDLELLKSMPDVKRSEERIELSTKLDEIDRLSDYRRSYYSNGNNLTGKEKHIINAGRVLVGDSRERQIRAEILGGVKRKDRNNALDEYMKAIEQEAAVQNSPELEYVQQVREQYKNPTSRLRTESKKVKESYDMPWFERDIRNLREGKRQIDFRYPNDGTGSNKPLYKALADEVRANITGNSAYMSLMDRIGMPAQLRDDYRDAQLVVNYPERYSEFVKMGDKPSRREVYPLIGQKPESQASMSTGLLDEIDTSYRGSHTAPYRDDEGYNPSLDDVSSMYGDDIYTGNALRYFGEGRDYDKKAIDIIQRMRGNPDAEITIYRALPIGQNEINPRDWVTTTREYALDHIGDDEGYHIVSKKVKASDVFTEGNSIHEFGYDPLEK
jgi:hypothetical protein